MRIVLQTTHPAVYLRLKHGVPKGVTVHAEPVVDVRGGPGSGVEKVLEAVIDVAINVDTALLAAWLYEKVWRGKGVTTLQINRIEVECEQGEITRVLVEQIKLERDK